MGDCGSRHRIATREGGPEQCHWRESLHVCEVCGVSVCERSVMAWAGTSIPVICTCQSGHDGACKNGWVGAPQSGCARVKREENRST